MADVDKIQKLLRLATNNPNETEATAAAVKACRLIVDGKIELRPPAELYESVRVNARPTAGGEPVTVSWGPPNRPSTSSDWRPSNYTPPPPIPECVWCHRPIWTGQPIAQTPTGTLHATCNLAKAMAEQQMAAAQAQWAHPPQPRPPIKPASEVVQPQKPWWKRAFA